jgi:hypothetical protein
MYPPTNRRRLALAGMVCSADLGAVGAISLHLIAAAPLSAELSAVPYSTTSLEPVLSDVQVCNCGVLTAQVRDRSLRVVEEAAVAFSLEEVQLAWVLSAHCSQQELTTEVRVKEYGTRAPIDTSLTVDVEEVPYEAQCNNKGRSIAEVGLLDTTAVIPTLDATCTLFIEPTSFADVGTIGTLTVKVTPITATAEVQEY